MTTNGNLICIETGYLDSPKNVRFLICFCYFNKSIGTEGVKTQLRFKRILFKMHTPTG